MTRNPLTRRAAVVFLAIAATSVAVLAAGRALPRSQKICPDYICYWAAGTLVASGRSPYDPASQIEVQRAAGWEKERDGLGLYDFLPFYYPPWFALLCAAFVPLGYPTAKAAWLILNAELLLATAYLARNAVPGIPGSIPTILVPLFIFSWASVVIGQTTALAFFLVVSAWRLLDSGRDRWAGAVLAYLTFKPQLSAVLLPALLVWSARRGRWGVAGGFVAGLAVLMASGFLILPSWPAEFLSATRVTPPPTEFFPKIGTTWFLLLKIAGLRPPLLWAGYLAVAIPFSLTLARSAIDRSRTLAEVLSIGLLAAYVLMPYGRHYDFPVLLIPLVCLLDGRMPGRLGAMLMALLLVVPYAQYSVFPTIKAMAGMIGPFSPEFTFSWIPAALTIAWMIAAWRGARPGAVSGV